MLLSSAQRFAMSRAPWRQAARDSARDGSIALLDRVLLRLRNWNDKRNRVVCTYATRDVAFSGRVLDQHHAARRKRDLLPTGHFDFASTTDHDHVLPATYRMPVLNVTRRRPDRR